ncbi:NAD-dependent deacetylase hst3 [Coemansia thaxteri]|uniref:NAD-dependent deacetylase hst3 n=1 Tax=Coemansia thaxteri TaxID=2663907 RepID=A0A9W8BN71_9FUNG|nr:NAD-dependent deacetylase hst3 [Coemansia thaxteri]KAJ2488247.1 NAD-dependent deacetylase hst3 [Coemansia sp. RSA 2320]
MPETLRLCDKSTELSELISCVAAARRVVVVTGAGISVNCGIPDFRSSTGLFQQIQAAHGDVVASGRDLFDASVVFRSAQTAKVFYHWMTHLRQQCAGAQPGVVHRFIRQLADRGALLRSYTQNIDGLERKAGLSVWDPYSAKGDADHVPWQFAQSVPLHGTMEHLACQLCSSSYHFPEHAGESTIRAGDECPDCHARSQVREACGRRSLASGKLRPTVVLYEEPHPHCEDIAKIISHDARALGTRRRASSDKHPTDVVLVFGTTLKVPGCRQLVRKLATASPETTLTIFVNNEPVCGRSWDGIVDYQVIGNVEDWCARVEHKWRVQTKITRWAKTRKNGAAISGKPKDTAAGKENAAAEPLPELTALCNHASISKKRARLAGCSADEQSDTNTTCKGKRQRSYKPSVPPKSTGDSVPSRLCAPTKSASDSAPSSMLLQPVRRSLRIATQQNIVYCHSPARPAPICT